MKKLLLVVQCFTMSSCVSAQAVETAVDLRSSGKIWIVVLTILLIFIGIVFFLIRLERKIKKLEDQKD